MSAADRRQHHARILAILRPTITAEWTRDECVLCTSSRVDLATIEGGVLCGYEIKSDADSLARLFPPGLQEVEFSAVFDRMTLVCGPRHRSAVLARLPAWWGVSVVDDAGNLHCERSADPNPLPAPSRLAHLFWTTEARAILRGRGLGRSARTKHDLTRALSALPEDELRSNMLRVLSSRVWRVP